MNRSLNTIAALVTSTLLAVSCGVVSFTGRKQILLFSDSEITALSDQSYAEFMSSAKISSDVSATNALKQVGEKMLDGKAPSTNDFFSTHPSDAKRIAALKEAIQSKPSL